MSASSLTYAVLKARQRNERGGYPDDISVRIHRALSWLGRAEACDDDDGRFMFLWIAFNAAYASDLDDYKNLTTPGVFSGFIKKMVELDSNGLLHEMIWTEFSGGIRLLLDNKYVFKQFWEFQAGLIEEGVWKRKFAGARRAANRALGNANTGAVLRIVFSRLYVMRNQIVHGGATWNSGANHAQLRDCASIMGKIVPYVILIMMDNPKKLRGKPHYPVVGEAAALPKARASLRR
ncbi:MAG: HEPN domain-containing protein [Gammaproteobacteria bacterium]